jgi:hypothetical protein
MGTLDPVGRKQPRTGIDLVEIFSDRRHGAVFAAGSSRYPIDRGWRRHPKVI